MALGICPRCDKQRLLTDESEAGITFHEPLCRQCRRAVIKEIERAEFDERNEAYERAIASGWED